MAQFKEAYNLTIANEGLFGDDPSDLGGFTWKGVSQHENPDFEGWPIIMEAKDKPNFPDSLKSNATLETLVQEFYLHTFWTPLRGDEINSQDIANKLYDSAVNVGLHQAVKELQESINVPETEAMDNFTLNTLNGQ